MAKYPALLVVVDRLTKLVHVDSATDAAKAKDVAQSFLEYGIQGSRFTRITSATGTQSSQANTEYHSVSRWGTKVELSSAYNLNTDGQTGRMNKVIVDI